MGSPYVPLKGGQFGHTPTAPIEARPSLAAMPWMTTERRQVGRKQNRKQRKACAIIAPLPNPKKFRAVGAVQMRLVEPASAAADCEIRVERVRQASSKISPSIAIAIPPKSGR